MYRIDPSTGETTEEFRYPARLGDVSRDPGSSWMSASSWGGRRILDLTGDGEQVRAVVALGSVCAWLIASRRCPA